MTPDVMKRRGWDCVEAMELNLWTEASESSLKKELPLRGDIIQVEPLLRSIANIRHNAVHRRQVSNWDIESFLFNSVKLARILKEFGARNMIFNLFPKTKSAMDELQENRKLSQSKLQETLQSIAAQEKELARLKCVATAEKEKEDQGYEKIAMKGIQEAIKVAQASFFTPVSAKTETGTGSDATDDTGRV